MSTWTGVLSTLFEPLAGVLVTLISIVAAVTSGRKLLVVVSIFLVMGTASGLTAGMRSRAIATAEVPEGDVVLTVRVAEEPTLRSNKRAVIAPTAVNGSSWDGPRLALTGLDPSIPVGSTLTIEGYLRPGVSRVRDEVVAGIVNLDELVEVLPPFNPIVLIGNATRDRVTNIFDEGASTDGLVRGLLIGDTDLLSASDEEDLRRAGLAHYIAVSGSNVAMFLVAWWFMTSPIAVRPVLRVVCGIVGLAIFAVVTRWEPSVIRASVMAGTLLVSGLIGIPLDPWMALGTAVTLSLLASGHLGVSVGFQLSVAATAGVLIGVRAASGREPRWLYLPLLVTVGAQLAVAPIILAVFGTIPLLAPLANLIAGPMVAVTTAIGALALILPVVKPLVDLAAGGILAIAGVAAQGPQLGLTATCVVVLVVVVSVRRGTRSVGVAACVLLLIWGSSSLRNWPDEPTMVVLDIGQGDAILLQDPYGGVVLVDGGSDPSVLDRALRRNGVKELDLVVVTHGDLDHLGGVVELLSAGRTPELWIPAYAHDSDLLVETANSARNVGVNVVEVERGVSLSLPTIKISVIGPLRRYATENDGSVILWVTSTASALLGGDIGEVAQRELPSLSPDIMVVPHHGSRSTDLEWLAGTVGSVAILSYGENSYGHPHPEVLDALNGTCAEVHHTYIEGDVVVSLATDVPDTGYVCNR